MRAAIALLSLVVAVTLHAEEVTDAQRQAAVEYFKGSDEPSVRDATWTDPSELKLGRFDTGGSSDGFAIHACRVLGDILETEGMRVAIWDYAEVLKGNIRETGSAYCLKRSKPTIMVFDKSGNLVPKE